MRKDSSATLTLDRLANLQLGIGGRALTCATCVLGGVAAGLEISELPPFLIFLGASTVAALLAGWQVGATVALCSAIAWWLIFRASGPGVLEFIGFAGVASLDLAVVAGLRDAVVRLRTGQEEFGRRITAERAMLAELDHRFSNTLQSIASGLGRQARSLGAGETRMALNEATARVSSFGRIHRRISEPAGGTGEFLDTLCHELLAAFGATHVALSVDCDGIELDPARAETVALIVVELLTNVVKHAFPPATPGHVWVSLRRSGPDRILEVRDDGIGMTDPGDGHSRVSLGLGLVRSLARRIGGAVSWSGNAGTVVTVEFRS